MEVGIIRKCCRCFDTIGCYQPESIEASNCEDCVEKLCPDTSKISHGLCIVCFEIVKSEIINLEV